MRPNYLPTFLHKKPTNTSDGLSKEGLIEGRQPIIMCNILMQCRYLYMQFRYLYMQCRYLCMQSTKSNVFLKWTNPGLFLFTSIFKQCFTTRIVRVKGEHTDHLTTTKAHVQNLRYCARLFLIFGPNVIFSTVAVVLNTTLN